MNPVKCEVKEKQKPHKEANNTNQQQNERIKSYAKIYTHTNWHIIADGDIFNFKCNRFIPYKQFLKTFYSFEKILLCAWSCSNQSTSTNDCIKSFSFLFTYCYSLVAEIWIRPTPNPAHHLQHKPTLEELYNYLYTTTQRKLWTQNFSSHHTICMTLSKSIVIYSS